MPEAAIAPSVATRQIPILRAAYSDRTAALMATLARLAYDFPPKGSAPGPAETIPSDFKALGFDRITYFLNPPIDAWAYVVEGPDLVALVFRGTQSIENWHTNFQVEMLNPRGTDPNLRVHKGFLAAFNDLSDGQNGLRTSIERIKTETGGTVPIYIAGHSLGGALAQIATAVFGCDQIAACYTFGSPRVGNAYFDLWVKPPSYRIENYADIVPQIPVFAPHIPVPAMYRHSGDPRYLPDHMQGSPYRYEPGPLTRVWQFIKGLAQLARSGEILGIEDHSRTEYERKLAATAVDRSHSR